MARGKSTFKQADLTRAAKAAMAAGLKVVRIEIDTNGKLVLQTERGDEESATPQTGWEDA